MIIHVAERDVPYAQIERACLDDERLSYNARGLLAHLLSKPTSWDVSKEALVKTSPDSRRTVQKALAELVKCGYAKLEAVRSARGRVQGKRYTIAERPRFNVPSEEHRQTTLPSLGKNRRTVKPMIGKTDDRLSGSLSKNYPESNNQEERNIEENPPILLRKTSPRGETGYSAGFEGFWQMYPVKKGKGQAWRSWQRQHLDPLQAMICRSIEDHLDRDEDWRRNYIKHPATFLNGRCWEDDLATVRTPLSGMTDKEYRTLKNSQELMEMMDHDTGGPHAFLSLAERHGDHV